MKTARLFTLAAVGAAVLLAAGTAHAGKKKNASSSKQLVKNAALKNLVHHDKHHHHHHHHHRHAKVIRYCHPVVVGVPVTVVPAGAVMELPGFFGVHPGKAVLDMGGPLVYPKVIAWTPKGIVLEIPYMHLVKPVHAKLIVVDCHGHTYRPFFVKVVPAIGGPVGHAVKP